MQNYHRHTSYSNIMTTDSAMTNMDYVNRAVELGHKVLSSVEHGWQGYYYEVYELAKKHGLKFIFGAEAYWVKDRHEKDKTNAHIILLARNESGRRAINRILSDANEDGYYYRPRVDLELLYSLPTEDVFITTACVGFWQYQEDIEEIVLKLYAHFGANFMLEIQCHNTDKQKQINETIRDLNRDHGIEMIVGLDSHYITEAQAADRNDILAGRGLKYDDEEGWFMDYPDDDTVRKRFAEQGVFSPEQVERAMANCDLLLDFEDIVLDDNIKLPTLYPHLSQEERNSLYSRLISKKFKEYMKDIPSSEYDRYYEGVKMEVDVYKKTGMVDYPLIDYQIVKRALELGGIITDSGRGSGVGYFTNTLCGFSKVDRFKSPVKLYPERFISATRILKTRSLPDLDLNTGNPEIFAQAQEEVMGKDHAYPMICFGTLKKKAAFKLFARAKNLKFITANEVSKQLEEYDEAIKFADDDEREQLDIFDFVDEQYHDLVRQSMPYWGIIGDKKKAPCAYLLYQGSIREEIGLIKCKSDTSKKEYMTTVIDGNIAENYKFLKNDILKVDVTLLIHSIFERAGERHLTVNELLERVKNDDAVWNIYANGWTVGVNQVEKESTTRKRRYAPHLNLCTRSLNHANPFRMASRRSTSLSRRLSSHSRLFYIKSKPCKS